MSLFFMETAIGQSTGLSTIRIFNMIPMFQGRLKVNYSSLPLQPRSVSNRKLIYEVGMSDIFGFQPYPVHALRKQ